MIKTLEYLIAESKLKIGDIVTHCDDNGEAEPILAFKLGRTRSKGNRLHVILSSGEYRAKEVCLCPSLEQIQERAKECRDGHFECKEQQRWDGKTRFRDSVGGIRECRLR